MCALLEPHDIGVALAGRLRELYKRKLASLDSELKTLRERKEGRFDDDKRLYHAIHIEKQWHAANEVYMWVTNLLEHKEVNNG
jgi:RNA binding exosome subunit